MNALLDALGFVGDALDRPGAAVRGLLAGRPDQLGYLIPGAETLGLVDPDRRVTGADLLRQSGLVNGDDDSWGTTLGGMAVDLATNPLSYLPALGMLGKSSRFGPLKAARSNLAMAQEVDPVTGVAGRIVGGGPEARGYAEALGRLLPEQQGVLGMHMGEYGAGAALKGAGPATTRHEVVHSLVDQVARGGSGEGMPWPVRLAGRLRAGTGDTGPRSALGLLADETAAHALENRGLMGQVGGAGRFLFDNTSRWGRESRPGFAAQLAERSPLVAALFNSLPYAPAAGAGALGGAGLYSLTN